MIKTRAIDQLNVSIIILNWNGWRDTIECLESVFRLNHRRFNVVVCDNASSDGSFEKIRDWAEGKNLVGFGSSSQDCPGLALIQTGSNRGFAGGNNVGIRHALERSDCDYVWLLNNDTIVDPDALSAMLRMMYSNPGLGVCGSLLRSYAPPREILTAGGRRYSRWSGRTRPLVDIATPQISTSPGAPDYIEGASMLISRRCIEQIGLLEERYFLYSEEIDYVVRARSAFHFGFSPDSVIYHKEGASIGTAALRMHRSILQEFYLARNRLLFTWWHYPWFWPSVFATVVVSFLQRLLIGKPKSAAAILRGALASFSGKLY
ncbi:hypothetical protein HNQ77_003646 [Silvibacterium bohemicum]|uniref:Glycosyltransferase 2-like domain-containing protein n=1 Tax=Silvibacterium bohemicum TaxID=1577686 RepID=A0A841JYH2_9BACT|nr:glycosyltransferase family 2 protein [Silvibacterium bohemicum]MBB6145685.1 hypothetical protein [Silvibacterium bohemicum]